MALGCFLQAAGSVDPGSTGSYDSYDPRFAVRFARATDVPAGAGGSELPSCACPK